MRLPLQVVLSPLSTSLHYPLLPRLKDRADILIFNPPYVPTDDHDSSDVGISAAWAGGMIGMTTTKLVLEAVPVSAIRLPRSVEM